RVGRFAIGPRISMKPARATFVLAIFVGTALAQPVVDAQAPAKVARIGWMSRASATAKDANMDAFRQGMRELGYVEGRTFMIEPWYAGGRGEMLADQAAAREPSRRE